MSTTSTETYKVRISKMTAKEAKVMRENAKKNGREDVARLCDERLFELEKIDRLEMRGLEVAPGSVEDMILRVHERYEAVKSLQLGRRFVATRTRPMFERWGIIGTAERTVIKGASGGFEALVKEGEVVSTWEAVIAAFPDSFNDAARQAAYTRLSSVLSKDEILATVNKLQDDANSLASNG